MTTEVLRHFLNGGIISNEKFKTETLAYFKLNHNDQVKAHYNNKWQLIGSLRSWLLVNCHYNFIIYDTNQAKGKI